MWFEARKQERKIRSAMIDHKRRQERRRNFYERIRRDPTDFMQLHGRRCKIYVDPAIAQAAESAAILRAWQGDAQVLIDRFDARSHLDTIVEYKPPQDGADETASMNAEERRDERRSNYERYRILVLNDFDKTSEDKFLRQIYINEYFGGDLPQKDDKKKKAQEQKAAIAYTYEDSTGPSFSAKANKADTVDDSDDEDLDEDELANELLQTTERRIDISRLSKDQCKELNQLATNYSIAQGDFTKFMWQDHEEEDMLQQMRELEQEKANLSGKQSRRERKLLKELHAKTRGRYDSPASLGLIQPLGQTIASTSKRRSESSDDDSDSSSRDSSPVTKGVSTTSAPGKIEYITSFGGDVEKQASTAKFDPKPRMIRKRNRSSSTSTTSSKRRSPRKRHQDTAKKREHKRSRSRNNDDRGRYRNEKRKDSRSRRDSSSDRNGHRYKRRRRSSSSNGHDDRRTRARPSTKRSPSKLDSKSSIGIRRSQEKDKGSRSGSVESELSMLSVRSSMSESEQEKRQIENTKRRLKNTKRIVSSTTKYQHGTEGQSSKSASKGKTLSLRERLALQTQKALKKTVAKDKEEENKRREELLREQMEREEEMREMCLMRQKERREVDDEMRSETSAPKRGNSGDGSSSSSRASGRASRRSTSGHGRGRYSRSRSKSSSSSSAGRRRRYHRNEPEKRTYSKHRSRSRSDSRRRYDRDHSSARRNYDSTSDNDISEKKLVDY